MSCNFVINDPASQLPRATVVREVDIPLMLNRIDSNGRLTIDIPNNIGQYVCNFRLLYNFLMIDMERTTGFVYADSIASYIDKIKLVINGSTVGWCGVSAPARGVITAKPHDVIWIPFFSCFPLLMESLKRSNVQMVIEFKSMPVAGATLRFTVGYVEDPAALYLFQNAGICCVSNDRVINYYRGVLI